LPFCAYALSNKAPKLNAMSKMGSRLLTGLLALAALCAPATAQRSNYAVKEMNFDLWCQEQARLPIARCDKRTPEDEATFQAYRAKVEAYEIPYLQRKDSAARLDRDIMRTDPVGSRRVEPQDPTSPSTKSPPR
jgi:hypothetical protein